MRRNCPPTRNDRDRVHRRAGLRVGRVTDIRTALDASGYLLEDARPDELSRGVRAVAASPDVTLPAEAFARLVYGRLDAEHTPAGKHGSALDTLRRLFPGP